MVLDRDGVVGVDDLPEHVAKTPADKPGGTLTLTLGSSLADYHRDYGLDGRRLRQAAPDAIVTCQACELHQEEVRCTIARKLFCTSMATGWGRKARQLWRSARSLTRNVGVSVSNQ